MVDSGKTTTHHHIYDICHHSAVKNHKTAKNRDIFLNAECRFNENACDSQKCEIKKSGNKDKNYGKRFAIDTPKPQAPIL
jgi:hypothetical protein